MPKRPPEMRVDRRRHARDDRRRQRQHGGRSEQLDLGRDGGEARHQREDFEIVVPELALAAEAAQLDHRKREIEAVVFGLLHDLLVELEARLVLRRRVEISQPLFPIGMKTPMSIEWRSCL